MTIFGNTKQIIQDYDTVFDHSIPFRKNDLEYKLNVVDCNASVTVARPEVLNLSQWGSGGYPQPPEANVKDVYGFPCPPPGLLGILRKTQFLRYYSVRELG